MINIVRLVFTVVFGFIWYWVYTTTGASLHWLVLLGSVLAVCVCCCRGDPPAEWTLDHYFACIRRCLVPLIVLVVSLFILGFLVAIVFGGGVPVGGDLARLLIASIGAPLLIRLICCAYD